MARPELTEEEIADFREELCNAALGLLADGGAEAVTMRALARKVGCSHTTPYRYFDSKQAIIGAVQQRCFEEFADFHESRVDDDMGAREQLFVLARGYVEYARDNAAAFRVMFDMDEPDDEEIPGLQDAIERSWTLLCAAVKQGIEEGLLEGKVKQTTFVLWSSLHGLTALNQAGKLGEGVADAMIDPMVEALIRAHEPRR